MEGEPPQDDIRTTRYGAPLAVPPEGRRGRPIAMNENLKEHVCMLIALGLSRRQTAAYLNIVHGTIANAIDRDPEFAERVARAEQMAVIKPTLTVAAAGQKNYRAAIWLINRNERRLRQSKKDGEHDETRSSAPRGLTTRQSRDQTESTTDDTDDTDTIQI